MSLPSWISDHKADPARATFWLVRLGLATPIYLTDGDQPVFWDSHTFAKAPLKVEGIQADVASATANGGRLSLASGGSYWQPLLAEIAGGARDFEVKLWEAWLDPAALPSAVPPTNGVRLVAVTKVEAAEWDREWATFTLGPSADPALARLPFREYGPACTYRRFKGPQCGYAGSETECDRTLARCTALSNSARFGGFRYLPAEEVEVTWKWQTGGVDYISSISIRRRSA